MSHFSVWVIGPEPEKQLAPYDENLEVPAYKEYQEGADLERMQQHYKTTDLRALATKMEDWTGQKGGIDEQGLYTLTTANPRAKWDWYELGGRWLGSLILKARVGATGRTSVGRPGVFDNAPLHRGGVDQAVKGDVDFEAMEREARLAAEGYFTKLEQAVAGLPPAMTWRECLEAEGVPFKGPADGPKGGVERARLTYGDQPAVLRIRAADLDPWSGDAVESLRLGREGYVTRTAQHSWVPRAVVREGEWNEVGRMGWWGMSSDGPEDFDPWAAEVRSVILNLPDDTLISVMDCHI